MFLVRANVVIHKMQSTAVVLPLKLTPNAVYMSNFDANVFKHAHFHGLPFHTQCDGFSLTKHI